MGYHYIILGTGRQGTACAYDLARFGDAERIYLMDADIGFAQRSEERLRRLLPDRASVFSVVQWDVREPRGLIERFRNCEVAVSAVPYYFNPQVARAAIAAGVAMCDLGGDTPTTLELHQLNEQAGTAGSTILPDCGLAPGMCNLLAVYGMESLDRCEHVRIRCGGLPQVPVPPLGYRLAFNLEGLLNNYFGKAYILHQGKVAEIQSFTEPEQIEFPPPLGHCEAFVTAGAASTCPWTFAGKLQTYEYKTVRYPGHYEKVKLLWDLGLLSVEPVTVDGGTVIPRKLFTKVAGERLAYREEKDLVILRVICEGRHGGRSAQRVMEVMEFYDDQTGFSAMERTTGFAAGIVASLLARRKIRETGVLAIERAVPADLFVGELVRRGIKMNETLVFGK
jgi:lysine 6-dehydrogenase